MVPLKNKIKVLRKKRGLSLQQLGYMSGSSKAHIWQLEKGHNNPTIQLAYTISKALGKNVEYVFPDENKYKTEVVELTRVV